MSYLINDSQFNALSGNLQSSGQSLFNLISSSAAGVSKIYVTGHPVGLSGNINFSGQGGLVVSTGVGNFIYFSGSASSSPLNNGDGINLSGNLQTTGSTLYAYITNFSGVFNNSGVQLQSQINALKTATGYLASIAAPSLYIGSGSPEGVVSATSGSIYTDYFNVLLYQKITGVSIWGWR